jgi:hypothetical protein
MVVRYTIVTLPVLFLIFSLGWHSIRDQRLKLGLLLVMCVTSSLNLFVIKKYYSTPKKTQFRELSREISGSLKGTEKIISDQAWFFNYYFNKYSGSSLVDQLSTDQQFIDTLKKANEIWILAAHDPLNLSEARTKFLEENFDLVKHSAYINADGYFYRKKK